jgi:hypothetical protein
VGGGICLQGECFITLEDLDRRGHCEQQCAHYVQKEHERWVCDRSVCNDAHHFNGVCDNTCTNCECVYGHYETYVTTECDQWVEVCDPNALVPLCDGDIITYTIERDVVASDVVEFALQPGSDITWFKAMNVPDPNGHGWTVCVQDGQFGIGENDCETGEYRQSVPQWAGERLRGLAITFSKAKFLGNHWPVYRLGNLDQIPGGSRVTFHWLKD